ncbi:MAG: hypothetical protein QOE37_2023 [Microbacteriaceae bacterium]|nr:hypothetical protein [Microbacteriaceae bacterium]
MSRARVLLLAPVLAAGILVAGAGPASAAAQSPNANCIGASASFFNLFGKVVFGAGGFGGYLVSGAAHAGNPAYVCF